MTKEKETNLKNHLIHTILEWAEKNDVGRAETADVLCELSKDMRSGSGNLFTEDK
jgi:hypothetical protein